MTQQRPIPNFANAMIGLREDPVLRDVVRYDEMARLPMLTRAMPKHACRAGPAPSVR
jgi:hypothetical protein